MFKLLKKNSKFIIIILLLFIMQIMMSGKEVKAADLQWDISKDENGDMFAILSDDGTLTISAGGEMKDWVSETEVAWHESRDKIKKVIINRGVTTIGDNAFYGCTNLQSISIPVTLEGIGNNAFYNCKSIRYIGIPIYVTKIGNNAFYGCVNLTDINISEEVTNIGNQPLANAKIIKHIDGTETTIELPEILKRAIDSTDSFYANNDFSLSNCEINNDGKSVTLNQEKINLNGSATITINDGVLEGLTYIIVRKDWDVSENGDGSIIAVLPEDGTLTIIGTGKIKDWESSGNVDWYNNKNNINKIIINEGITGIGDYAFADCIGLTSIEIPYSVETIGDNAFFECKSLVTVEIPGNVKSIGKSGFCNCTNLESVTIPSSVTSIGESAFALCEKLKIYTSKDSVAETYAKENGILVIVDDIAPSIIFEKNGNTIAAKKQGTKVTITDSLSEVDNNSLRYVFTESINTPLEEEFTESFSNGDYLEKATGDGEWYLWILAKDKVGNRAIAKSDKFVLDNTAAQITQEQSNQDGKVIVTLKANEEIETVEGWTLSEDKKVLIKEYTESKEETITIKDMAENETIVNIIAPSIIFEKNGNIIAAKKQGTKVTVADFLSEVDNDSLRYVFTESINTPSEEEFTESFSNGDYLEKATGDGEWYLWILAKDKVGNRAIAKSDKFVLDNTAAQITQEQSNQDGKVIVTLKANEEIETVEGWTLSEDKKVLIKEYTDNKEETIIIKDLAGNETTVNIKVEIQKEPEEQHKGDVNKDGKIDITDLLKLLRQLVIEKNESLREEHNDWILTEEQKEILDINEDGRLNTTDVLRLLRHIAASKDNEIKSEHPDWIIE